MSQITAEENKALEVEVDAKVEVDESFATLELKLSDALNEYFQNKDIAKEANERASILKDKIEDYFERIGGMEAVSELKNGTFAKVKESISFKNKLDVDALAEAMQVSKDELKTPFDFSAFTKKGQLTPDMVSKYSKEEQKKSLRISRLKKKPKDKKQK